MLLYYFDESESPRYYVRSALGIHAEQWNDLFRGIHIWWLGLRGRCGITTDRELHCCDLLAGRGPLPQNGGSNDRLTLKQEPRSSLTPNPTAILPPWKNPMHPERLNKTYISPQSMCAVFARVARAKEPSMCRSDRDSWNCSRRTSILHRIRPCDMNLFRSKVHHRRLSRGTSRWHQR